MSPPQLQVLLSSDVRQGRRLGILPLAEVPVHVCVVCVLCVCTHVHVCTHAWCGCVAGLGGMCATAPSPHAGGFSVVWSRVSLGVCMCVHLEETVGALLAEGGIVSVSPVEAWLRVGTEQANC